MMAEHRKLLWKKIATRHLSFLFVDYVLTAYPLMEKKVGTTLHHCLASSERDIISLYRTEEDLQRCYSLICALVVNNPQRVLMFMDDFEQVMTHVQEIIRRIHQSTNPHELKELLLKFDHSIKTFMFYQLFFVYLGYAAHIPAIVEFLKEHGKRVERLRMSTLYQELDRSFSDIFGRYDKALGESCLFMTRKEIVDFITSGKRVDASLINERKERYLRIMRNFEVADYPFDRIGAVLKDELSHISIDKAGKEIFGTGVYPGLANGKVSVVLSHDDYKKITPQSIVVTSMTVPDMVLHLSHVKGIVTNDGGMLCHAAIVAREMKIPTVVGTVHATDILKDGDLVEVDADKGIVRKIK